MPTEGPPVLEARGISRSYRSAPWGRARAALRGLDLVVGAGEVVALVGPNGAGKSTALRVLAGLARADSGAVVRRAARAAVGWLSEEDALPLDLSPREILAAHAAAIGPVADVEAALVGAGLADRSRERVGRFSKGMRRRLALAVALLGRPALLFLDEPWIALDPWGRSDVRAAIAERAAAGAAVLVATQDLAEAERVAARAVLLFGGEVRAEGRVEDLRARGGLEAWALGGGA